MVQRRSDSEHQDRRVWFSVPSGVDEVGDGGPFVGLDELVVRGQVRLGHPPFALTYRPGLEAASARMRLAVERSCTACDALAASPP